MKERLLEFLRVREISNHAFERAAGLSDSTVYNLNKGLRSDKLAQIALAFPELNIRWLLTGEGEMLSELSHAVPNKTTPTVEVHHIQTINIGNWQELVELIKNKQ